MLTSGGQHPRPMPHAAGEFKTTFRSEPRVSDAAAVRDIVASTGFFHDFEIDVAVELVEERLSKGLASEYHFVLADDASGRLVGYTCFGPVPCTVGSFDLYWIAVHESQRGRGLGQRLMSETEAAIRHGVPDVKGSSVRGRVIYIETSGREKYAPTQAFYGKCGYVLEARLRDFYDAGDDKLIYAKHLGA